MYKKKVGVLISLFCALILLSCSNNSTKEAEKENPIRQYKSSSSNSSSDDNEENNDASSRNNNCNFKNDTYSATVDYNNPETNFSNTYTLEVEVEDCQIIKIYFPKGGWLDEDHISAADIDDGGNATVEGEDGKTYEIHIEN
jgi:hypothetical protein